MQGNLHEIDIRTILQLIEVGQRTGLLLVESQFSSKSWFIFFLDGKIIYATNGDSTLSRLQDYLRRYQIKVRLDERQLLSVALRNVPEYSYLVAMVQRNIIKPQVARSITHHLINETLFELLDLRQGNFIFQLGSVLSPVLNSLEITPVLVKITRQAQEWKHLYPHISHLDEPFVIVDLEQLKAALPTETVSKLILWTTNKTSLRQLARYFHRDIVTVAKTIYPYVLKGWVRQVSSVTDKSQVLFWHPARSQKNYGGRILCIDDTITVCRAVESILQPNGYEVMSITNPLEALSVVFQKKPDLILCDITMPHLDGYEICAMLRNSQAFRQIPIIVLTAKEGFIDRVKAKMVGATDYLTKPFKDSQLLMLVEKHLIGNMLCS